MGWILQIDTALETAVVSLAKDGRLIGEIFNHSQKDHAAFLHPAVKILVEEAGIKLADLKAVAVVEGPGSYTGLRVGLAAAKGLCFALNIPLITVGTLYLMGASALTHLKDHYNYGTMLVCPMIDARRMEVYTALYNSNMEVELAPHATILNADFLVNQLLKSTICFFGTGSEKWKTLCDCKNALFLKLNNNSLVLSELCYRSYIHQQFKDVAYTEPFYLKEFYFNEPG